MHQPGPRFTALNRRRFLTLAVAAPTLALLASCTDGNAPADTTASSKPTTTAAPTIAHPMGADEVVLQLSWEGGFVPEDFYFTRLPRLVITGDGSVYVQGAQIEIYPGPLLPPILVGKITESELQALLASAQGGGLFRNITYADAPTPIADAPNTVLVINAAGATFTHNAYALGIGDSETDADRLNFAEYVELLDPVTAGVPQSEPFVATRFAIRARVADETAPTDGITPNELEWPATAGVSLATASECAVVEASALGDLFSQATQITRFVENGIKYVLLVRPMIPGDRGC